MSSISLGICEIVLKVSGTTVEVVVKNYDINLRDTLRCMCSKNAKKIIGFQAQLFATADRNMIPNWYKMSAETCLKYLQSVI